MPYYRQVGDVPRKRHSYVPRRRRPALRGAHGPRRVRAGVFAPLPPRLAERDRRRRTSVHGAPAAVTPDLPVLPRHFRTDAIATGSDAVRGRGRAARQRGRRASHGSSRRPTASSTATRPATNSSTCSRATVCSSRASARIAVGPGDYVSRALRHDPPLARRSRRPARGARARSARSRPRAAQVPHATGASSAKARRSPSAICAGPTRRSCATAPTCRCSCAHAPG